MENYRVSFEIAKQLKELGFNESCLCYYDSEGIIHLSLENEYESIEDEDNNRGHFVSYRYGINYNGNCRLYI